MSDGFFARLLRGRRKCHLSFVKNIGLLYIALVLPTTTKVFAESSKKKFVVREKLWPSTLKHPREVAIFNNGVFCISGMESRSMGSWLSETIGKVPPDIFKKIVDICKSIENGHSDTNCLDDVVDVTTEASPAYECALSGIPQTVRRCVNNKSTYAELRKNVIEAQSRLSQIERRQGPEAVDCFPHQSSVPERTSGQ